MGHMTTMAKATEYRDIDGAHYNMYLEASQVHFSHIKGIHEKRNNEKAVHHRQLTDSIKLSMTVQHYMGVGSPQGQSQWLEMMTIQAQMIYQWT